MTESYPPRPRATRLYRIPEAGRIAGVCAGIADYFGLSTTGVRLVTVLAGVFFTLPVVFLYACAALFVPPRPRALYASPEEEAFWRGVRTEPAGTVRDLDRRFERLDRRLQALEAGVTSPAFKVARDIRNLG